MTMRSGIRQLFGVLAAGAVATVAVGAFAITPASAGTGPGLCALLPVLCPPTTPPTTKATPTTTPPATTPPTTTHAPAATTHAVTKTTTRATSAVTPVHSAGASVGIPGLAVPATGPIDLPGSDVATAPQLANEAVPTTSTPVSVPLAVVPNLPLPGLVETSGGQSNGLPSDHSAIRIALSLLVLGIAVVAAAQLPASRRVPRTDVPLI